MSEVNVYIRDAALNRVALLDDFQRLGCVPKFNDVGTWQLDLDRGLPAAKLLSVPNYGIEVVHNNVVVMSGPVVTRKHTRSGGDNSLALAGVSDDVWLQRRIAHMQPLTAQPPYNSQEHDVRTGIASTVLRQYVDANAGPSALSQRRVPGLSIADDPAIGTSITGRARLQVLIELLRELALAGGGLGFRVVQSDATIQFQVFQPQDRSASVKFSEELQNLAGHSYEASAPESTYVFVGGGGEGTARTFVEGSAADLATFGRIETFRDRRDTTDVAEIQQAVQEELAEKSEGVSLSISPVDTEQQKYGVHYGLGDKVTVIIEGEPIVETIRQVDLSYTPDGPLTVSPQIGTVGQQDVFRLFRAFRSLRSRLDNVERR